MSLITWWHHFTNPHCVECAIELQCDSCETLRQLLAQEKIEKQKLLDTIIELTKPEKVIEHKPVEDRLPLNANMVWKKRRQMLEEEDRNRARVIAEQKLNEIKPLTTEELEEQLGIKDAPRNTEEIS